MYSQESRSWYAPRSLSVCYLCSIRSGFSPDASPAHTLEVGRPTALAAGLPRLQFGNGEFHHQRNGKRVYPGGLRSASDPMHSVETGLRVSERVVRLAASPCFSLRMFRSSLALARLASAPHRVTPIVHHNGGAVLSIAVHDRCYQTDLECRTPAPNLAPNNAYVLLQVHHALISPACIRMSHHERSAQVLAPVSGLQRSALFCRWPLVFQALSPLLPSWVSVRLLLPPESSFPMTSDSISGRGSCSVCDQNRRSIDYQSQPTHDWPLRAGMHPRPGALVSQMVLSMSPAHPPEGVDWRFDWSNPTPLLRTHYRCINAITGWSVLGSFFGTLSLAFLHLTVSLGITNTEFPQFRWSAWIELTPSLCRTPLTQ